MNDPGPPGGESSGAPAGAASARGTARRRAFQILYQADMTGVEPAVPQPRSDEDGEELPAFARELVEGVAATRDELDLVIGRYAREWTVERMPPVDRTILRLACYELLYRPDTPVGAAINEAVVAAKELSTEDSGRFVNGVLGAIARETALPDREG